MATSLTDQSLTLRLLAFPVGNLTLGFPLAAVQKIIPQAFTSASGLSYTGVAHLEDQELTVLDLHQAIFRREGELPAQGYLIVVRGLGGEFFGVPVPELPTLLDCPREQVRQIPPSYRRSDTLGIASHVALVAQEGGRTEAVFILDPACLGTR